MKLNSEEENLLQKSQKSENEYMQFEKSIEKLNVIIEKLESEEITLEETLKLYKEGSKLISSCKKEIEDVFCVWFFVFEI